MGALRRSYHSEVKFAAYHRFLPDSIARLIPKSSLFDMRHRDPSYLWGSDYAAFIEQMDLMKEIARSRAALRTSSAVLHIVHLVRSLKVPFERIARIKDPEVRGKIVSAVERFTGVLPRERILKLLGLTPARFSAWSRNRFACLGSPRSLCLRVYPNQLSRSEVSVIRRVFSDPVLSHWPYISVAWQLIHTGKLSAHVQTITRYARRLGLISARGCPHRSRKRGSIATTRPNEAWHLDATIVTAADNQTGYVQLLQDNFSRKIIAWKAVRSASGVSTSEVLQIGYRCLTRVPTEKINLIVDGGPENNNAEVEGLLQKLPLRKLVAGLHVTFLNSMIEAVNKILKYRYLFRKPIPDIAHLETSVATAVADYNDRPHGALCGLTPNQVYVGLTFDKEAYQERVRQAVLERRSRNRHACPPCLSVSGETTQFDGNEGVVR